MEKKKILITYASYGSGHKTIAKFIGDYIENDKYEIETIDILDYVGKVCKSNVKVFNYIFSHKMEFLFTTLYKAMDNKLLSNCYNYYFKLFVLNKKLRKLYCDYNPDLVISTHFYGSNIAYNLNKNSLLNTKIMTMVTDYKSHDMWMSNDDENEIFIVANEIVKREMINKGCASSNIYPFGLPHDEEKMINVLNEEKIKRNYKIDQNKKVILFFAGGSIGNVSYLKYLKELICMKLNAEILFVCGNCKELKDSADKVIRINNIKNVHVFGYVNNVYELLKISDLVITKPGAATVTECLEMKKTMILLPGMGGQEKYNAKFISKNGYGIYVRPMFIFKYLIYKFMNDSKIFKKMNENHIKSLKNESLKQIKKLVDKELQ